MKKSEKMIEVKHVTIVVRSSFEKFTASLLALVGRFNPVVLRNTKKDPALVRTQLDLPSSLFGRFRNEEVIEVGKDLDGQVERLIGQADIFPHKS